MKHIKVYEGFFDKIKMNNKCKYLAKAIYSFINKAEPKLNCKIQKSIFNSYQITYDNGILIETKVVESYDDEFGPSEYNLQIVFYTKNNICDFILEIIDGIQDNIKNNLGYITNSLTEENYKDFLVKIDAEKYNL